MKRSTKPGEVVSVDQLESPIVGLIPQAKGSPTKLRYRAATIFVDHFSDLTYIHLQTSTSGEETLKAKQAFERYASQHGVAIKHYHCDNG